MLKWQTSGATDGATCGTNLMPYIKTMTIQWRRQQSSPLLFLQATWSRDWIFRGLYRYTRELNGKNPPISLPKKREKTQTAISRIGAVIKRRQKNATFRCKNYTLYSPRLANKGRTLYLCIVFSWYWFYKVASWSSWWRPSLFLGGRPKPLTPLHRTERSDNNTDVIHNVSCVSMDMNCHEYFS